ncbi:tripartite motif-containing protein 10-like isoform X2 [Pelodiscus sinensis]|uniref:tripartite motif-containing protein 10-like isoform X2 n=1 Tax=Pelodiscus sinensis TaxID=13735 RepID=UPI003F6B2FA1
MGHSPPTITISSHHAERSKPKELPAAMAAATPAQEIQEESKCPICLEYLTDPVSTDCGHSFCRGCITQHCETWGKLGSDPLCCPSCKARIQKGSLQSNHQLANIVEKLKQLDLSPGNENLCGRHGRALDLFCEEDWEAVCVVCWRSREHRSHPVLPLDQAAQPHKEKLQAHVATLRERRAKLLRLKETSEQRSQQYLKQTQAKRQKIVAEFQQLRQFLEEQERLLLAQLQKLEEEIRRHQTERGRKLSEQISRLSERIGELEGKCQKPDIRSTLSRCEEGQAQQPEEMAPELEERVRDFSQQTIALSERLRVFKGTLAATLVSGRGYIPGELPLSLMPPRSQAFWPLPGAVQCLRTGRHRAGCLAPLARPQPNYPPSPNPEFPPGQGPPPAPNSSFQAPRLPQAHSPTPHPRVPPKACIPNPSSPGLPQSPEPLQRPTPRLSVQPPPVSNTLGLPPAWSPGSERDKRHLGKGKRHRAVTQGHATAPLRSCSPLAVSPERDRRVVGDVCCHLPLLPGFLLLLLCDALA